MKDDTYEAWYKAFRETLGIVERIPVDVPGLWKLNKKQMREFHDALGSLICLVDRCPDMERAEKDLVGYDVTKLLGRGKLSVLKKVASYLDIGIVANLR